MTTAGDGLLIRLKVGLVFTGVAMSIAGYADSRFACSALTENQIVERFSNTLDIATIEDGDGGVATNHWYADGRMTSSWKSRDNQGFLEAFWWVEGGERCVKIHAGSSDVGTQTRCAPVLSCDGVVTSVNAGGDVHGRHMLSALPRTLPLAGTRHTRDLGGYLTVDGRVVKRGLLFRSDHLGALTEADGQYLSSIGIKQVTDFRSKAERARTPDRVNGKWKPEVRHIDVNDPNMDPVALGRRIMSGQVTEEELMTLLGRARYIEDSALQSTWGGWLRSLADDGAAPHLFHCTAGKDRTGFAAALVLLALGVPETEVRRDFLLSNKILKSRIEGQVAGIQRAGYTGSIEPLKGVMGVSPVSLDSALTTMKDRFGSIDAFLHEGLGLTATQHEALKRRYLYRNDPDG